MLTLIVALKAVIEIALLALLAQGLLWVLAGRGRAYNPVYRVLQVVAQPAVMLARRLAPRRVPDRRMPLLAFALLSLCWLLVTLAKLRLCVQIGVSQCR
jgi:hypothetical protein